VCLVEFRTISIGYDKFTKHTIVAALRLLKSVISMFPKANSIGLLIIGNSDRNSASNMLMTAHALAIRIDEMDKLPLEG
jgi:hypothetical protein